MYEISSYYFKPLFSKEIKIAIILATCLHAIVFLLHLKDFDFDNINRYPTINVQLKKPTTLKFANSILSSVSSKDEIKKLKNESIGSSFSFDILQMYTDSSFTDEKIAYLNKLKTHIEDKAYNYIKDFPNDINTEVKIKLVIYQNGNLNYAKIIKPSNIPIINSLAMEIAENISPYPAIPKNLLDKTGNFQIIKIWKFAN